jgi:hypothetical protein
MVKAAKNRSRYDSAEPLDDAMERGVFDQGSVSCVYRILDSTILMMKTAE